MSKITPLNDFILLELPVNEESRIVVPETADKTKVPGSKLLVIKVGPNCKSVKPGDRILCDFTNAMIPFALEKRQVFMTKESNVLAVIKSEESSK